MEILFVVLVIALVANQAIKNAKFQRDSNADVQGQDKSASANIPRESTSKQIFEQYFDTQHFEPEDMQTQTLEVLQTEDYRSEFDPHDEPHYQEGHVVDWGSLGSYTPVRLPTISFVKKNAIDSDMNFETVSEKQLTIPGISLTVDEKSLMQGLILSEILKRPYDRTGGYGRRKS